MTSCNKDNPNNFTAEDYIGTFGRDDNCDDSYGSSVTYNDVKIVYGTSGGVKLQDYAACRGWSLPSNKDINGTVDGNTITLTGSYSYTGSWGTREWEFTGTGKLSDDKTKLTISYRQYYEDENGDVKDLNCTSVLTRK